VKTATGHARRVPVAAACSTLQVRRGDKTDAGEQERSEARRVLTMERLHGAPLTDLAAIRAVTAEDPERILINALNTWFGSVLACPSFHADVHAGARRPRAVLRRLRGAPALAAARCSAPVAASARAPWLTRISTAVSTSSAGSLCVRKAAGVVQASASLAPGWMLGAGAHVLSHHAASSAATPLHPCPHCMCETKRRRTVPPPTIPASAQQILPRPGRQAARAAPHP